MKALLERLDKEPGPGGYENASTDYVAVHSVKLTLQLFNATNKTERAQRNRTQSGTTTIFFPSLRMPLP
jgi:hypothetical protein